MKIWKCCRTLFSLGSIERRDAYSVLSLYLSSLPCTDEYGDADIRSNKVEGLDIRAEKEFWNEIKRGLVLQQYLCSFLLNCFDLLITWWSLIITKRFYFSRVTGQVDRESLVRKQSLHMLKKAVRIKEGSKSSSVSEIKLSKKQSVPQGMTKRELWAEMEAQSLGVGRICNSVETNLTSQQKWEAYVLLYEMLEEYGTHLVEAAWNHQVHLLVLIGSVFCVYSKLWKR